MPPVTYWEATSSTTCQIFQLQLAKQLLSAEYWWICRNACNFIYLLLRLRGFEQSQKPLRRHLAALAIIATQFTKRLPRKVQDDRAQASSLEVAKPVRVSQILAMYDELIHLHL